LEFQFLRPRWCLTNPFRTLSFCFGVISKNQVSSPVTIWLNKFLSASAIAVMSWQDVTWSSLCSGVKECGIKCAHNFLFPKSSFRIQNQSLGDVRRLCYYSWCDSTVTFLTISATAAMFTSVWFDFGQPLLSSSSTRSLPSRNRKYRLKTFDRFTALFPKGLCTNTSVSVTEKPALKQTFMVTFCSLPPSKAYKEYCLYKKIYNSYTVEDKQTKLSVWTDVGW
jgi:hypothetical protein